MSTHINLVLDIRRAKKDGAYPIKLVIYHFGKRAPINTGYSIAKTEWDKKDQSVKKNCKRYGSIERVNAHLLSQRTKARGVVTKLGEQNALKGMSVAEVKQAILASKANYTFLTYGRKYSKDLRSDKKFGSADAIDDALSAIYRFNKKKDLRFEEINVPFLKKMERWHTGRGNSLNGLAVYLRSIRLLYNNAINDKLVDEEYYPFSKYKIKTVKTRKRALKSDVVKVIEQAQPEAMSPKWHARNYFLFSFYAMGMNLTDMGYLRLDNLKEGRISYIRSKTKKPYSVKISPKLRDILRPYTEGKGEQDYVFPIIKRTDPELQRKDIENAHDSYRKWLNRLAEELGIENHITSYMSRHTWASVAKKKAVPPAIIQQGLGHEDARTTEIYLDSIDSDEMDDWNDVITGG